MCETLSEYEFSKYLNFQIIDYYGRGESERERERERERE